MGGSGDECTVIVRLARGLRKGGVPLALKLAELFLLFVMGLYMVKICIIVNGMYVDFGRPYVSMFMFLVEVLMLVVTCDSVLVISSRRPKAWKKVVRASFLLVIFNLVAWMGLSQSTALGFVALNPALVTPFSLAILVIMFTRPVRSYYVPLMEDDRPLKDWVKSVFASPLYTWRATGSSTRTMGRAAVDAPTLSTMAGILRRARLRGDRRLGPSRFHQTRTGSTRSRSS